MMVAGRRWCLPWKCFDSSWFTWSGAVGSSWVRLEPGNNSALPRKPSKNIPLGFQVVAFSLGFCDCPSITLCCSLTLHAREGDLDEVMRMMPSSFWSWWFMMWRVGPSILPWSSLAHHLIRLIVFCWSRASNFYVGWTGWGWVESPLKAELPGQHVYCSYRPSYILDWRPDRSQSTSVLFLGLMLLAHSSTIRGVLGITPFGVA